MIAGLGSGVMGGLVMLAWFAVQSRLDGRVWWAVPNLLSSTFYGQRALRTGFGMPTLAGMAFHLFLTGLVGAAFGLALARPQTHFRMAMLGMLAGIGWHYLSYGLLWQRINPLVPVYTWEPAMLGANLLLGICLSLYPRYYAGLERHFLGSPPEPEAAPEVVPQAEVRHSIDF